jgi:hypothetical protein
MRNSKPGASRTAGASSTINTVQLLATILSWSALMASGDGDAGQSKVSAMPCHLALQAHETIFMQ